jgi:uncharacterized protein
MTRRSLARGFFCSLSLPVLLRTQSTNAPSLTVPQERVLIHVHSDDPADWRAAVEKANAYMSNAKPYTTVVEILATGDGLKLVDKNSQQTRDVMNSLDQDVSFVACHASMKSNHMTIDQLHSGVGTVPSGSREIAMRKSSGWTILDDKALK